MNINELSKTGAPAPNPGLTPLMLNHAAWVTHDVEATAAFYTRIMGMELASTVYDDRVPSTGDPFPYFHIFFRMGDGSTIAFFEAPPLPKRPSVAHPAYEIFDHIALEVKDRAEVLRWYDWLKSNKVEVIGPTDHTVPVHGDVPHPLAPEYNAPVESTRLRRSGGNYLLPGHDGASAC